MIFISSLNELVRKISFLSKNILTLRKFKEEVLKDQFLGQEMKTGILETSGWCSQNRCASNHIIDLLMKVPVSIFIKGIKSLA